MNRNIQLALMFLPLLLLFAGLGMAVNDLRHPQVTRDRCKVTAVGPEAISFQPHGRYIYRQSQNPLHEVSLQCKQEGCLLLNDLQLRQTPLKRGQEAEVLHKRYRFLPERWAISVHTGGKPK
jgi:hypothetical protein